MEIKLSIKQEDIEQAIRDYVVSKGITTPVREINFQVARKGGFAITAEVEVSEIPSGSENAVPTGPVNRKPDPEPEPEPATKPKAKAKPAPKKEEPEPKPEPEPVAEDESVAEDEPPFEPDTKASNDEKAEEKPAPKSEGKSLFG